MQFEILLVRPFRPWRAIKTFYRTCPEGSSYQPPYRAGPGMSSEELRELVYSALLHDIGRGIASQEDQAEMDHASLGQLMIPVTPSWQP